MKKSKSFPHSKLENLQTYSFSTKHGEMFAEAPTNSCFECGRPLDPFFDGDGEYCQECWDNLYGDDDDDENQRKNK